MAHDPDRDRLRDSRVTWGVLAVIAALLVGGFAYSYIGAESIQTAHDDASRGKMPPPPPPTAPNQNNR
jgi:hypothetical protein